MIGDRVFLDASHHGRGKGSGFEVSGRMGYLYDLSDGKIEPSRAVPQPRGSARDGGQ